MTDAIAPSSADVADPPPSDDKPAASPAPSAMSDIDKIKAAHAARRSRRSRPPRPPSSSVLPPPPDPPATTAAATSPDDDNDDASSSDPAASTTASASASEGNAAATAVATLKKQHEEQVAALRQELTGMRVELSSLRRNNLQNVKKVTEERDMFAAALAKEQTRGDGKSSTRSADAKKLVDVEAQLRAARTRNADLEAENNVLREDVKQLNFRVQASKTLDAASDGYNKVVDELVDAKLKCAQLLEEKEDLLRINKELTSTSAVLRDANGDLEKSRSEWVLQCAEVEKQRSDLEERLKALDKPSGEKKPNEATSYTGSDLQELKL